MGTLPTLFRCITRLARDRPWHALVAMLILGLLGWKLLSVMEVAVGHGFDLLGSF